MIFIQFVKGKEIAYLTIEEAKNAMDVVGNMMQDNIITLFPDNFDDDLIDDIEETGKRSNDFFKQLTTPVK